MEVRPNHYEVWMRNVRPFIAETRSMLRDKATFMELLVASARKRLSAAEGASFVNAGLFNIVTRVLPKSGSWSTVMTQLDVVEARAALGNLYGQVVKDKVKKGDGIDGDQVAQAEVASQLMLIAHLAAFKMAGQQSYLVSEGLAERLLETELRGLRADDLRLPHRSLYVEVPRGLGLRFFNHLEGWKELQGVYVYESDKEEETDLEGPEARVPHRRWFLALLGANDASTSFNGINDFYFCSSIGLPDGVSVDDAVRYALMRIERRAQYHHPKDAQSIQKEWSKVFTWVMNTIIYTTWPNAEREHVIASDEARRLLERIHKVPAGHPRRKKLNAELADVEQQRRIILGKNVITLGRRDAQAAGEGEGRPLVVRTLVQGHWRHLEPGPGKPWKEKKLLWIEPFWRGPEDGPTAHSTAHIVKG